MDEPVSTIECIIFSKNRACQLDALLRSIKVYAAHLIVNPIIYWTATEPDYIRAYDILIKERWQQAMWCQDNGRLETLVKDTVTNTPHDAVCFLVDDDVFYRPAPGGIDKLPFSLRLGLNTDYCQPLGVQQRTPVMAQGRGFFHWNWSEMGAGDFSYPFSLDGTIYRRDQIASLINAIRFSSPTQLEAAMDSQAYELPFRLMYCAPHSSLVSIPANRVSDHSNNPVTSNWTAHLLNQKYLEGYRIDISKMDFSHISSAHQGVDYEFKPASTYNI